VDRETRLYVRGRQTHGYGLAFIDLKGANPLESVDELRPGEWHSLSTSELRRSGASESSYLVDPASSHMLVSKIKPCMSNLFDGILLHG